MSGAAQRAYRRSIVTVSVLAVAVLVAASVQAASAARTAAGPDKTLWFAKTAPGITHSKGARATYDRAQGVLAAKAQGKKVKRGVHKIGLLQIVGQVASAQRSEAAATLAVKTLGWKLIRCDAQGDPAKMESCGQSLLTQGAEAILTIAIEPSFINGTLVRAKEKGVPVFAYAGSVSPSQLQYNFSINEAKGAKTLAAAAVEQLQSLSGTRKVAVWTYPSGWANARTKQFSKAVSAAGGIEIAYTSDIDGLNPVDGTRAGVETQLTQTPDLRGFWFSYDAASFGAAQAIKSRFPGKTFPDAPCIWTISYDPPQADAMRKGEMCIVMDQAYDVFAWVALDQAAELLLRKKTPSRLLDGGYGPSVIFDNPAIITPKNQPPAGSWVQTPTSAPTFFTAKWNAEFTK